MHFVIKVINAGNELSVANATERQKSLMV